MDTKLVVIILAFCGAVTIASLATAIVFGNKAADSAVDAVNALDPATIIVNTESKPTPSNPIEGEPAFKEWPQVFPGENQCEGQKEVFYLENVACVIDTMTNVGPQAGGNVTKGYNGEMEVDYSPITDSYYSKGLCPVNVHWHLGTEHYSAGEYDDSGTGPHTERMLAAGEVRGGYRCNHYDASDPKFTTPYEWKYCDASMEVGETYEIHWPHSAVGACGTPNQYQTPFYDGVFCNLDMATFMTLQPQDIANAVGVQGQVFTIVNDESYFYPDLMRGMIVDGEMGQDVAMYTGSTTGTSRDNEICSQYSPITWQVDRKCHMISASTFDKMCMDMMAQRDDMSDDLYAHGSRELVDDALVANNHANRKLLRAN
jgi:hypothetical protein